jgi:hypothetical protein
MGAAVERAGSLQAITPDVMRTVIDDQPVKNDNPINAARTRQAHDFTGAWFFDRKSSSAPPRERL